MNCKLYSVVAIAAIAGCGSIEKLPAGTQIQSSTFGVRISPQAVDGTPLALGSHTTIVTTAQPEDGGPNVNRFEGRAPGIHLRSTVASGPVGEQLREAGGPQAVRELMSPGGGAPPLNLPAPIVNP